MVSSKSRRRNSKLDSIHTRSQGGSRKRKHLSKESNGNLQENEEDEIDNVYGLSMSMRKKAA
jgi:hypothetical protein